MNAVTNESLTFEQRNLLLGARSRHVCHSHRIIREMRRLGLVTDVLPLRGRGNSAAVLTPAGETLREQVVAAFEAAATKGDMAVLNFRFGQAAA